MFPPPTRTQSRLGPLPILLPPPPTRGVNSPDWPHLPQPFPLPLPLYVVQIARPLSPQLFALPPKGVMYVPPESKEGTIAVFPEFLVLQTAGAPHCFHHLFVQLHGWREYFWVTTKDVTKIYMDQMPRIGEQQVIQVTVTNTKQISKHTVPSCT